MKELLTDSQERGVVLPTEMERKAGMSMGSLFAQGQFRLHAGEQSSFKIDCAHLTGKDLRTLAEIIAERVGPFREVAGIPSGGLALAAALEPYRTPGAGPFLLVDDVLTTGTSMEEWREALTAEDVRGVVLFARREPPVWIEAVFTLWRKTR